jgi:hypothetical protein
MPYLPDWALKAPTAGPNSQEWKSGRVKDKPALDESDWEIDVFYSWKPHQKQHSSIKKTNP